MRIRENGKLMISWRKENDNMSRLKELRNKYATLKDVNIVFRSLKPIFKKIKIKKYNINKYIFTLYNLYLSFEKI